MKRAKFTDIVSFCGTSAPRYNGIKRYVSTGALDVDHIDDTQVEVYKYEEKPSRANLVVPKGAVLFAKMQATKKTLVVDEMSQNNVFSTGFFAVLPKSDYITTECLYHLISSELFLQKKDANCSGATQKAITLDGLKKIELSIPDIEEQCEIGKKLTQLLLLIKKREEQLTYFEDLIKSQFIEMFGLPGTDNNNWGIHTIAEIAMVNPKKGVDSRLRDGVDVSFVPMPMVGENGEFDGSIIKKYEEVKTGFTYFAEGDVLFAKITPCMENGKGAIAVNLKNGVGFGSTEFHVLRPVAGKSNARWLYALTTLPIFRKEAERKMTGSAGQRRVPSSFISSYKIALPPIELQNEFARFVEQTDKSKFRIKESLENLENCYKALLQKYFG